MPFDKLREPAENEPVQAMDGFAHHFACVNGLRLHHVKGGSGPAIVLLHSWPYTWLEWRKLLPLLADRFTVIVAKMMSECLVFCGSFSPARTSAFRTR